MELIDRVTEGRGQLLQVERRNVPGAGEASLAQGFLMTFDVGRILFEVDVPRGAIEALSLEVGVEAPGDWAPANEDEPWWRLLGTPVARHREEPGALTLQFRADAENPRLLTLSMDEGMIRVAIADGALEE